MWWLWAVVVLYGRCFVVVVVFVTTCIHGWSLFVTVGDHCRWSSLFIIVAVGGHCWLCVLLVVVRERKATSHMTSK